MLSWPGQRCPFDVSRQATGVPATSGLRKTLMKQVCRGPTRCHLITVLSRTVIMTRHREARYVRVLVQYASSCTDDNSRYPSAPRPAAIKA